MPCSIVIVKGAPQVAGSSMHQLGTVSAYQVGISCIIQWQAGGKHPSVTWRLHLHRDYDLESW